MFMIIVFLVLYFAFLSHMKGQIEVRIEYGIKQKNAIQKDIEVIDQLQSDYQLDYIHLFERVQ